MACSIVESIEVVKDKLYWSCVKGANNPRGGIPDDTAEAHYFSTDDLLIYDPYFGDFGPLNISQICRYCKLLSSKLKDSGCKRVVHCCRTNHDTRANSVLLLCCWSLLVEKKSPAECFAPFEKLKPALVPYRDASLGPPCFNLTVVMVIEGILKAVKHGWLDWENFDSKSYEHYERVENGDFNWLVPGKFLAFSGPTQTPIAYVDGVKTNTPETYFEYFAANNITGIVRFNNKVYDRKKFVDAGFNHYDMYFPDGSNPPESILKRFLEVTENEKGALAVHCKAGLGRTGTLISLYLMKHYEVSTSEIIGWLRVCRPGSVIGPQQNFLQDMEKRMHREGAHLRNKAAAAGSASEPGLSNGMRSLSVGSSGRASPSSPGCSCGSPTASQSSPSPMRPKSGFSIGGVSVGRSSSPPSRGPASSPLRQKATSLMKR